MKKFHKHAYKAYTRKAFPSYSGVIYLIQTYFYNTKVEIVSKYEKNKQKN